jgi:hypothetical protein
MALRNLHIVHLLIRQNLLDGGVGFLVYPHEHWKSPDGEPFLGLPAKKTVKDPLAEFIQGAPLDGFVDAIAREELLLPENSFDLDQELEPVEIEIPSPAQRDHDGRPILTRYTVYPVDLWVARAEREPLCERVRGRWLTCAEALAESRLSPTGRAVFEALEVRERQLERAYRDDPTAETSPDARRRLFRPVPDAPSMDALAREWLSHNLRGVRHLTRDTLHEILDAGGRAFNLRVADPYLRYHMQGQGFTWSFFTHKDTQDCHVHGAPTIEIYGVLAGELEVWSKPYYERGTAAWSHRIVKEGDWIEIDSLQCHIVNWRSEGKGVVFKAGPGPLADVGRLGVKGKTPCADCPCMKPKQVQELEAKTALKR